MAERRYFFVAELTDDDFEVFRLANLLTWADVALVELPDGRFEIVKGKDCGTIVRPENLSNLRAHHGPDGLSYHDWEC